MATRIFFEEFFTLIIVAPEGIEPPPSGYEPDMHTSTLRRVNEHKLVKRVYTGEYYKTNVFLAFTIFFSYCDIAGYGWVAQWYLPERSNCSVGRGAEVFHPPLSHMSP